MTSSGTRAQTGGAHQLAFGALATVSPGREDELRELLARMGAGDKEVPSLRFEQMTGLHFGRLLMLERSEEHGQPPIPPRLVLMSEIDAPLERHLDEVTHLAGDALDAAFGLCDDYPPQATAVARRAFLLSHPAEPAAAYVNTIGRTRDQILIEAWLRDAIEGFLDERREALPEDPVRVRAAIQDFVRGDPALAWALRPPRRPSLRFRLRESLHAALGAGALILAAPFVLLGLPAYLFVLRRHERADDPERLRPSRDHVAALAAIENFGAQNQFSAIGYVKPGAFRGATLRAVLWLIDYGARHVFKRADLAGVKTIHFARWTPVDGGRRNLFTSNYDGSLESYNDDFIDKVAFGLNAAFSNGIGYPRTKYLFFAGAKQEQEFKDYLRRHQIPTQVWYSAYSELSAVNIENNSLIRSGLSGTLAPSEVRRWLRRL